MPAAPPAAGGGKFNHLTAPLSIKSETNPSNLHTTEMFDPSSSSSGPIRIDGSEIDAALSRSELLTRTEVLKRRARRVKQLSRIYRDHYWALMEELKIKHREYYWEYGKSPFLEDEENENQGDYAVENVGSGRCEVHGCKAKAMALTRFCHMHILSDAKQKLYKGCNFSIKSSITGPILCGRPTLRSSVPTYCSMHFQKSENHMVRALKKAGLNVSSTCKLAPKLHVLVAEYVRQIQSKRRAAKRMNVESVIVKEEINP